MAYSDNPAASRASRPFALLLTLAQKRRRSADALRSMPRRADEHPQVFRSKRGAPIRGRSAHYWSWNPVRAAFWATLSDDRRRAIVDLDWHSLRHFCGWHF